jgi:predicted protein tyrosine phosphatase
MNRLGNVQNPYQGTRKKVLCVCSAGLLRSPTAAFVLSYVFDCNTRAAGITPEFALIPVDRVLLTWADEIVCMDAKQERQLAEMLMEFNMKKTILNLEIPDAFAYRDPVLIDTIIHNYKKTLNESKGIVTETIIKEGS